MDPRAPHPPRRLALARALAWCCALWPGLAAAQVQITIDGRTVRADVALTAPGGAVHELDVEIQFEQVENLSESCLGLSADFLDLTDITALLPRLPDPVNLLVDSAVPILVQIEPPAPCGLVFEDAYHIELRSEALTYTPTSPYRLYKADLLGPFADITGAVDEGSVRTRGRGGGFSQFLMLRDLLPNHPAQAQRQLSRMAQLLADPAVSATARLTLETDLERARAAFEAGDYAAADAAAALLDQHLALMSPEALPARWRSARDLVNLHGELAGANDALRFSLRRLQGQP